jgi:hypothetical protein
MLTMTTLTICWKNKESRNYVDIIPASVFELETNFKEITHRIQPPSGSSYPVKANIKVKDTVATLAYESSNNRIDDTAPGVTRIWFETSDRKNVRFVEWQDEGGNDFVIPHPPPVVALADEEAEELITALAVSEFGVDGLSEMARSIRFGTIARRPQQIFFSTNVRRAYEGKCALTRCNTPEALEAAHIKVIERSDDNNLNNGILLRADLHALFDAGLIALTLDGSQVDFSPRLSDPSYDYLRTIEVFRPRTGRPSEDNIRHHRHRFGFPS